MQCREIPRRGGERVKFSCRLCGQLPFDASGRELTEAGSGAPASTVQVNESIAKGTLNCSGEPLRPPRIGGRPNERGWVGGGPGHRGQDLILPRWSKTVKTKSLRGRLRKFIPTLDAEALGTKERARSICVSASGEPIPKGGARAIRPPPPYELWPAFSVEEWPRP